MYLCMVHCGVLGTPLLYLTVITGDLYKHLIIKFYCYTAYQKLYNTWSNGPVGNISWKFLT